ncbi:Papain family cysteine protease domain containing protein [Entamoeba marina]
MSSETTPVIDHSSVIEKPIPIQATNEKDSLLNDFEESPKINKHITPETIWALWLIYAILAFLLFAVVLISIAFLSSRINDCSIHVINSIEKSLPSTYSIPYSRVVLVKNQQSRGSCWIFATIGILESSYKQFGIENGLLGENEFVQFSEQAYGKLIFDYCSEHKEIPICNYGGMGINATSDGSVEFIYYIGDDAKQLVLPNEVCEYCPTRGECEFHCNDENLDSITSNNPINFTIKDIKTMYSVNEIKKTMFAHQSPISYGLATVLKTFYFECDEYNPENEDDVCVNCEFPCYKAANGQFVEDNSNSSSCCSKVGLKSYTNDAVFELHGEILGSGGHAMVIVGWNDEFRIDRDEIHYVPLSDGDINRNEDENNNYNPVKGGFIIKNSWGYAGHSIGYWMQNISEANEAILCPLTQSIKNYGAVDIECLKELNTFEECGFGRVRYAGLNKKRLVGGTKLRCITSDDAESDLKKFRFLGFDYCANEDANDYVYALIGDLQTIIYDDENQEEIKLEVNLRAEIPEDSDTQRIYHIARMKLDDDGNVLEVEELTTNYTTLQMLEKVFAPTTDVDVENSEHCGYYFQPYSTIRFLVSDYKAWGYESYAFSYLDIEWDKKSYLKGHEDDVTYDYIKRSTIQYNPPEFDGPFGDFVQ